MGICWMNCVLHISQVLMNVTWRALRKEYLSRSVVWGLTQPVMSARKLPQWYSASGSFQGAKSAGGVKLPTHFHIAPRSRDRVPIHRLLHRPFRRSVSLIKHKENCTSFSQLMLLFRIWCSDWTVQNSEGRINVRRFLFLLKYLCHKH